VRGCLALAVIVAAACAGDASHHSVAQDRGGAEIFRQMATVLQHPRCMNCHTREGFPRQGDDRHRHTMNVSRGPADHGAAGLHCATCHRSANQAASGVPGAADWHLAPPRMAWEGLSVGELCRALLDPAHGGMKPAQFVAHFRTGLVRWAWSPGVDSHGQLRSQPPLSYEQFIALTQAWVGKGSTCPSS
jgi:hypothetical protein